MKHPTVIHRRSLGRVVREPAPPVASVVVVEKQPQGEGLARGWWRLRAEVDGTFRQLGVVDRERGRPT